MGLSIKDVQLADRHGIADLIDLALCQAILDGDRRLRLAVGEIAQNGLIAQGAGRRRRARDIDQFIGVHFAQLAEGRQPQQFGQAMRGVRPLGDMYAHARKIQQQHHSGLLPAVTGDLLEPGRYQVRRQIKQAGIRHGGGIRSL